MSWCQTGREIEGFTNGAIECLEAHHWPGNVRELVHAVERAAFLGSGKQVDVTDLPTSSNRGGKQQTNRELRNQP